VRDRIASTLRGLLIVVAAAALALWSVRAFVARAHRSVAEVGAVAELPRGTPSWGWAVVVGVVALVMAALVRRPGLTRAAPIVALATVVAVAVSLALPLGHFALLTGLAVVVALSAGVLWREPRAGAEAPRTDAALGGALWLGTAAVMSTFAIHRYEAFGAGSWDLGCMIHNFYRASRLLDTTSTVLGDVDFLGDHFMVGIWVYSPLMWLSSSGAMYLIIQSVNLAASAPVVFAVARRRGAPREVALALALATGLSFGMQSAAYFDGHEIAVGFGFLAWGVWALEAGRWRLATALLMLFATFKESLGAYVVGIGLLAVWRGLRGDDRRGLRWGAGWIVLGGVWFVLVNRVLMPALRARANAPEPHETFGDFGPTVFTAVIGIASDPVRALAATFVPDEKLHAQLVTLSGLGWLPFGGPEVWLAALPLVAERFLSSKSTMWEMGYHYAAPLSLYAGWASAVAWPRVDAGLRALLSRVGAAASAPRILAIYVLVLGGLVNALGYRHPANFHRWDESYFSTPARREHHRGAVALLESEGREARLAVQNRILPHLADRPVIYRLGEWAKADWVLLSIGESAWPYDDGLPARLARDLLRDDGWRLVYAQGETLVFARSGVTTRPAVPAPPHLGLNR
jgi:uncharacterized membrane protein